MGLNVRRRRSTTSWASSPSRTIAHPCRTPWGGVLSSRPFSRFRLTGPMASANERPRPQSPVPSGVLRSLKALRKHWALVAATVLLASGIALMYAKSQVPVFEASSMLEINPHAAQPLGEKGEGVYDIGAGFFWDSKEYYETQYKIITSDRVLTAVARDLNLGSDYDFMGYKAPQPEPASIESAAGVLRGRVIVEPIKYSRLVLIKVDDTNPKRAKEVCDAVAVAYLDQNLQNTLSATSDAVTWLNGQVDHGQAAAGARRERAPRVQAAKRPAEHVDQRGVEHAPHRDAGARRGADPCAHQEGGALGARRSSWPKVSADSPDELPASELLGSSFLQTLRDSVSGGHEGARGAHGRGQGREPSAGVARRRSASPRRGPRSSPRSRTSMAPLSATSSVVDARGGWRASPVRGDPQASRRPEHEGDRVPPARSHARREREALRDAPRAHEGGRSRRA